MYDKVYKGTFLEEVKNRFLCRVKIEGTITLCYVPSSCRLDNFLDLVGKDVLLLPTKTPNAKTSFSLLAVPYKKSYILLNSSLANTLVGNCLNSRWFSVLGKRKTISKECNVDGYKCDFFVHDTETIIEVKSIISTEVDVAFPSVFSPRAIKQLKALKKQLGCGRPACFIIVSLNPYTRSIILDKSTPFYTVFNECLALGMKVLGFSCRIVSEELSIEKMLKVIT
jgi:DNA-binding sugar fermentation-stimulating protein